MHGTTQDVLLCSICSEKFNTHTKLPLLLSCFHTFCQECLQKLAKPSLLPPDNHLSITCPLCSKGTPYSSPSSLPINYALQEVVEASAASVKERTCDVHEEIHPASYWCFECEQSMCDEAHKTHGRVKVTKLHQTSVIGEPCLQSIRKQPLCRAHGKELDLVCTHSSHSPHMMVCILCIVTTHHGHSCVTVEEHFMAKQSDVQELLERAKEVETNLALGVAAVDSIFANISGNQTRTISTIDSYFSKVQNDIEKQRKELLSQLASMGTDKENALVQQQKSLAAALTGIQLVFQQLDAALKDGSSKSKALLMMEQIQTHLKLIEKDTIQPQYFDIQFAEAPYTLPNVSLVDSSSSISATKDYFPVVLSTQLALDQFEINISNNQSKLMNNTSKSEKGTYFIKPYVQGSGEHLVEVKLSGKHVKGSPLSVFTRYSWSLTQTKSTKITGPTMEATQTNAWGMIQEVFGNAKQSLTIKIDHKNTNTHCQIALYACPTVQFQCRVPNDYLATYNTYQKTTSSISILKLTREDNGHVRLLHDNKVILDVVVPPCYVYVDICHATTTAEIVE